jgi:hypothetical protein
MAAKKQKPMSDVSKSANSMGDRKAVTVGKRHIPTRGHLYWSR